MGVYLILFLFHCMLLLFVLCPHLLDWSPVTNTTSLGMSKVFLIISE